MKINFQTASFYLRKIAQNVALYHERMVIKMIVLYIFLIIIGFIILILSIPVNVCVDFADDLKVKIRYLFIVIDPLKEKPPPKPKKPKKEKKKKKEPDKKPPSPIERVKDIYDRRGAKGFLRLIGTIIKIIAVETYGIVKHLKVKHLDIYYLVGGEDAAATALEYGKSCAIVYNAVAVLKKVAKSKKVFASVEVDFLSEESKVKALVHVSYRPIFAVKHGIVLVIKILREILTKKHDIKRRPELQVRS